MGVRFTWDPAKDRINIAKHGVSFTEASTVFADTMSRTVPDPDHSEGEQRCLILGLSHRWRMLVVAHLEEREVVRIISARPASRKERRDHERTRRS